MNSRPRHYEKWAGVPIPPVSGSNARPSIGRKRQRPPASDTVVSAASGANTFPVLFRGCDLLQPVIYGLVDPLEPGRVRYVGKSATPHGRMCSHVRGQSGSRRVARWVARLSAEGRLPDMQVLEHVAIDAYGRERAWYDRLRKFGEADLNKNPPHLRVDFPSASLLNSEYVPRVSSGSGQR